MKSNYICIKITKISFLLLIKIWDSVKIPVQYQIESKNCNIWKLGTLLPFFWYSNPQCIIIIIQHHHTTTLESLPRSPFQTWFTYLKSHKFGKIDFNSNMGVASSTKSRVFQLKMSKCVKLKASLIEVSWPEIHQPYLSACHHSFLF